LSFNVARHLLGSYDKLELVATATGPSIQLTYVGDEKGHVG